MAAENGWKDEWDNIEIPTAHLGGLTMVSNAVQPEMVMHQNGYVAISGCRSMSQIHFIRARHVENPRFAVGISILSFKFRRYKYFRFFLVVALLFPFSGGVTISWDTVFELAELAVVENSRFAVGIWISSVVFMDIDICISSFVGHVAISGCRSQPQSPGNTVFKLIELEVVYNYTFGV